ncbi:hypothetical protein [Paenibacillus senegalimassiliensis]|uniref:hypothetical protein n=1 Tax=Paenibacillus senegalimassiliensis TaxID=1737426 RepID=UPI00073E2E5F|nr:hypothetical protein [Paenibacillus senegalimassiliensis]
MADGITLQEMDSAEAAKLAMKSEVGTLSNLQTTAKSNLVAAINEAFTSGNERKADMVAALVAKGVPATTSENWEALIGKMDALKTGLDRYIPRWYKGYNNVVDIYKFIPGVLGGGAVNTNSPDTLIFTWGQGDIHASVVTDLTINFDNIKYIIVLLNISRLVANYNRVGTAELYVGTCTPQQKLVTSFTGVTGTLRYSGVSDDGKDVGHEYLILDTSSLSGQYHIKMLGNSTNDLNFAVGLTMIVMLPGD